MMMQNNCNPGLPRRSATSSLPQRERYAISARTPERMPGIKIPRAGTARGEIQNLSGAEHSVAHLGQLLIEEDWR